MNSIEVRGGKRKELAVEHISRITETQVSEMIAIGDSITDINMLDRLKKEGGIAVSFNGNKFSLRYATIAVTSINGLGLLPIFENHIYIEEFLENWEILFPEFRNNPKYISNKLISTKCKDLYIKYNFIPEITNLKNKSTQELEKIILKQENMRKIVRGWVGKLG